MEFQMPNCIAMKCVINIGNVLIIVFATLDGTDHNNVCSVHVHRLQRIGMRCGSKRSGSTAKEQAMAEINVRFVHNYSVNFTLRCTFTTT